MKVLHAARKVTIIIGSALLLAVVACFLPEDPYQRAQLLDGTDYETLGWSYDRIHFDPRPVDVAILGASRSMLGLSSARVEQQLRAMGWNAHVANFSVVAEGRNLQSAIVDELYRYKSPKVIVMGVISEPFPYGHPAFKYFASNSDIVFPPAPLLHNYFYDLVFLPFRHIELFGAWLFPDMFGLSKHFDPQRYQREGSGYTGSGFDARGTWIDMDHAVPREKLLEQLKLHPVTKESWAARLLKIFNDGDDHVYIRQIAQRAQQHHTKLIFVYMPGFDDPHTISDRAFLKQYGEVLSDDDLLERSDLFMDWSHFNHTGALLASDRLAQGIMAINKNEK